MLELCYTSMSAVMEFLMHESMVCRWGIKNAAVLFMLFLSEYTLRTRLSACLILYSSHSVTMGIKLISLSIQCIILSTCVICTKSKIQVPHRLLVEPHYFAWQGLTIRVSKMPLTGFQLNCISRVHL